jgi:hypothetical protein
LLISNLEVEIVDIQGVEQRLKRKAGITRRINVELPEAEKLIVKLYMTERSEQKASPIIMICCCDKATRKDVVVRS